MEVLFTLLAERYERGSRISSKLPSSKSPCILGSGGTAIGEATGVSHY